MDAVILAGGKGERLKPLTNVIPKPLLPIMDKSLIEILIENLYKVGIKDIFLIVSYKKEEFKRMLSNYDITIVEQKEPIGTADALRYAEDYVGDKFITFFGDCIYMINDIKGILKKFSGNPVLGVKYVENVERYGVLIKHDNRYEIVEKPSDIKNGYALTGLNILTRDIFRYIKELKPSIRGEYELTDALNLMLKEYDFDVYNLKEYWKDIGTFMDYMDACFHFLENSEGKILGEIEDNVKIKGKVILREGSKICSNSYIEGNVYIGRNTKVGPFSRFRGNVIIGDGCKIGSFVEIKNSIIFNNTNIPHLNYVGDSIIASNCNLGAGTKIANLRLDEKNIRMKIKDKIVDTGRRKFGCVIGFNTKIGINVSINPGRIIGNNCKIGPGIVLYEDLEDNTFIILKQEYIIKRYFNEKK